MKSPFKVFPLISRLVVFVAVPILIGVISLYWQLQLTLPQVGGSIKVSGINGTILIERDLQGIARIEATTDNDAFFAVGFAHAQDRLWQMEVQRRLAFGRLSEMFGKSSVPQDIWMRTLGLQSRVESAWSALSEDARRSLESYSAGVNAQIASRVRLPFEFWVFGVKPEPWTVYDSLAITKLFALELATDFRSEMRRLYASRILAKQEFEFFFPGIAHSTFSGMDYPEGVSSHVGPTQSLLSEDPGFDVGFGTSSTGSNVWVVSGLHTQSGSPVLANDPHLRLQIPSSWYAVAVRGETIDVQGMTLVGLPIVVMGRNRIVGWGASSMTADAQDLYIEQVTAGRPGKYRDHEEWRDLKLRREQIAIQADFPAFMNRPIEPIEISVRETRRGPIVSDVFPAIGQPVSLRWTALEEGDTSYEAFYRLNYADSWKTFQSGLQLLVAPALNVAYADVEGHIGMLAAGNVPIRANSGWQLPRIGWSNDAEWTGYIEKDQLPRLYDPASGMIVNANNSIVDADYPYVISNEWADPARATRIESLLREKAQRNEKIRPADMHGIQHDVLDLKAAQLVPALLDKVRTKSDEQEAAKIALKAWNGEMSQTSEAAAIYQVWFRQLKEMLFANRLATDWNQRGYASSLNEILLFLDEDDVARALDGKAEVEWCAPEGKAEITSCDALVSESLNQALSELRKLTGSNDIDDWQWGKVHHAIYEHSPFSYFQLLNGVFERRAEDGGSRNTVKVSGFSFRHGEGFMQTFGPNMRQVIEMDPHMSSHFLRTATGQSGNFIDPNYDDMLVDFVEGEMLLPFGENPADHSRLLTLEPR